MIYAEGLWLLRVSSQGMVYHVTFQLRTFLNCRGLNLGPACGGTPSHSPFPERKINCLSLCCMTLWAGPSLSCLTPRPVGWALTWTGRRRRSHPFWILVSNVEASECNAGTPEAEPPLTSEMDFHPPPPPNRLWHPDPPCQRCLGALPTLPPVHHRRERAGLTAGGGMPDYLRGSYQLRSKRCVAKEAGRPRRDQTSASVRSQWS